MNHAERVTIMLYLILGFSIIAIQTAHENKFGQIMGKEDITNYVFMLSKEQLTYLGDPAHFVLRYIVSRIGYPAFQGWFLFIIASFIFYWMSIPITKNRSMFVHIMFFGTSYFAFALYVGLLSQTLSFLMFCVMFGFNLRGDKYNTYISSILCVFIHYASIVPVGMFYFIKFYGKNKKISFIILSAIMIIVLSIFNPTQIINTKLALENPPAYFIFYMLVNPFLIGVSLRYISDYTILFFVLSLISHNGRLTLFAFPFILKDMFSKPFTNRDKIVITICIVMYAIMFQLEYINQTVTYMKNSIWV